MLGRLVANKESHGRASVHFFFAPWGRVWIHRIIFSPYKWRLSPILTKLLARRSRARARAKRGRASPAAGRAAAPKAPQRGLRPRYMAAGHILLLQTQGAWGDFCNVRTTCAGQTRATPRTQWTTNMRSQMLSICVRMVAMCRRLILSHPERHPFDVTRVASKRCPVG